MTDMAVGSGGSGESVEFYVPSKQSALDAVKAFEQPNKDYVKLPKNLADNTDVVKEFHDTAYGHFVRFRDSQARKDLDTYLKDADAKWRMAKDTSQRWKDDSTQKQSTLSHVTSGQFYNTVRLITAGERSIVFNDPTELPAKYVAEIKTTDYTEPEGKRVSEGQQLYAQYVWDKEQLETWVKNLMLLTNKNSVSFLEMAWKREVETRPERVVGYYNAAGDAVEWTTEDTVPTGGMFDVDGEPLDALFDEDGVTPLSYVFVDKTRVVKEWPIPIAHNAKDFYCDLELKDPFFRDQTALVIRSQKTYDELLAGQLNGDFMNVEHLTDAQLYRGETVQNSNLADERYKNASQTKEDLKNGLFDVFYVRMISPIKYGKDSEKWDVASMATIHEGVFVGDFGQYDGADDSKGAVCIMCRKDPYHYKNRFMALHSHEDEKGLVRLGYYTILECIVEELTVLQDQLIDNKTLAVKSPFVAEMGNLLSRDVVFRDGNQVIWVEPGTGGTALKKLDIPDMTQRFVQEYQLLKAEAEELAGITEALRGEFAGSRTTGTEYLGAREQSAKPAIEDAKQKYTPLFWWLFMGMAEIGRQFANPQKTLAVTNGKGVYLGDVNPTHLYGQLGVTVQSINNFESDLAAKQVMVNFIQAGGYDKMLPFMGEEGAIAFWKDWTKLFKMRGAEKYLPASRRIVEAEMMAETDYKAILLNPVSAMEDETYLPKPGEQHDIQIGILEKYLRKWQIMGPALMDEQKQRAQQIVQALQLYIQLHTDLKAQEGSVAPGASGGMEQPQQAGAPLQAATPPQMGGEANGDIMSGLAGQSMEV